MHCFLSWLQINWKAKWQSTYESTSKKNFQKTLINNDHSSRSSLDNCAFNIIFSYSLYIFPSLSILLLSATQSMSYLARVYYSINRDGLIFYFFLQSKISQDQAGLCGRKWETMEKNWQIYAGNILINLNSEIWLAKPMKLLCMRICIIHSNSTKQQLKQLIESSVKFLVRDLRPSNLICILTFALILNFLFAAMRSNCYSR